MTPQLVPRAAPTAPTCVFLIGPSGSGKTVIAQRCAQRSSWRLYDTDAEILRKTGAQHISDLFDEHGESHFRDLEAACLNEITASGPRVLVATGGGFPAIPGMMDRINAFGSSVYLKADLETLWKRLNTDPRQLEDRPLLRAGGKDALAELLKDREEMYLKATVTLDTDQLSVDEACALLDTHMQSASASR